MAPLSDAIASLLKVMWEVKKSPIYRESTEIYTNSVHLFAIYPTTGEQSIARIFPISHLFSENSVEGSVSSCLIAARYAHLRECKPRHVAVLVKARPNLQLKPSEIEQSAESAHTGHGCLCYGKREPSLIERPLVGRHFAILADWNWPIAAPLKVSFQAVKLKPTADKITIQNQTFRRISPTGKKAR
jgi:hypothetical protein